VKLDSGALRVVVKRIAAARGVALVGFRAAVTLAQYGWYNLRKVRDNVRLQPIALLNALVAEVAQGLGRQALGRLNRLDDLAAERGFLFPSGRRRRLTVAR
jgi:DNA-binding MurR/RpiR family transcriptional regulator